MISKLFILSCVVASSFALVHPKCKTEAVEVETQLCRLEPTEVCGTEEDGEIVFQHIVPDEPVCVDVVDTFCRPAAKEEDSCKEVTRKACMPSDKVVDRPSGKIPEFYAGEDTCRYLPKATCETKEVKVPKRVCEPIVAKMLAW